MTTNARLSQAMVETIGRGTIVGALCSGAYVEVLLPPGTNVGLSQLTVEVLMSTTSIVWPNTLTRAPRVGDLNETAPETSIRSKMDVGPDKIRQRATAAVRTFDIGLDLTRAQVATLDTFFGVTTAGGSLPFQWKHPRTGNTADFRFTSTPKYRPNAPRGDGTEFWRASFGIELLPGTEQMP